jgi:RNA polymerase-binding transcription factor DksA
MDKQKMNHFNQLLDEKWKKLNNVLHSMRDNEEASMDEHTPRELSCYDNHPADTGDELYTLEMNLALKVHEQSDLNDVKHALEKIQNGSYGKCEKCGTDIDLQRLEAIPETRLCMSCEEEKDASEINTPDQQYGEVFDSPFGRKYLNKREDDEFEGIDQLNDLMKYGSSDTPQDMGGYEDYEEFYTNEVDRQGIVEETDKISNEQYKRQLP